MCTTCESLLGLDKEGWQQVSNMNEKDLDIYLKDITDLERTSRIVNVIKDESEILPETSEETGEKETNPFTKAQNKKTKKIKNRKLLSTYDIDVEAKLLEQELNDL